MEGQQQLQDTQPKLSFKRILSAHNALDRIEYEQRSCVIAEPDGTVVFAAQDAEVPKNWSQTASDILTSKYFRKAGLPDGGGENSIKQVVERISNTIRHFGEQHDYFQSAEDAQVFEDELAFMLVNQYAAFNSPVWFNCGLHHKYGIEGSNGNYRYSPEQGHSVSVDNAYEYPQCSACFIQSVDDSLHSIFDLVKKEAKVFKYGSGTGTNFSRLRSRHENLSGGGTSSGVMSFLEVFDRGAGATKSGGTTRRAAKMVCLNDDHPEIIDFIQWKSKEEEKALCLIQGGYEANFNGEAYRTVSGQNSNNSVRLSDEFMNAWEHDDQWTTRKVTNGEPHETFPARKLMREIAQAAWRCADPGVQFDTTINDWHTCSNTDRIHASNPCSEFMFLDDTACNLASLNLMRFRNDDGQIDLELYKHAIRIFSVAMDILVDLSSYPSATIAENSYKYRPLGLGYANLGALLMTNSLPYDSDDGRSLAALLTSILCSEAYQTSAHVAAIKGTFSGYKANREPMLRVIRKHGQATERIPKTLRKWNKLRDEAIASWKNALTLGEKYGYRNSQMTVLAPTGTIGLLMDCDTTGVEPDFSLIKWKKLAGGGTIKIVNKSLKKALINLDYSKRQVADIEKYILGSRQFDKDCPINIEQLRRLGFTEQQINIANESIAISGQLTENTPEINPVSINKRGVDAELIEQCRKYIRGSETIEGAPHVNPNHLAVFDCANRCGDGQRFIKPMAHIKMMAAVQPFISGAISKTVNVPEQTSVSEIEHLYVEAWKQNLKAVAIYRDNSKASQPLNSQADTDKPEQLSWGERKRLPLERHGQTLEATVAGHKMFIRTGEYDDGQLGEIFIDMYKEGAAYRSMMNCFAQAVSVGLSYGVPLEKFVDMYSFSRFEPYGITDNPDVRMCSSIVDFIFRVLGKKYIDMEGIQPHTQLDTHSDGENSAKNQSLAQKNQEQSEFLAQMMGDAPVCSNCGHVTIRNGSCYSCLNCGSTTGCS